MCRIHRAQLTDNNQPLLTSRLRDSLNLFRELLHSIQRILQVLEAQRHLPARRQRASSAHSVLDLPSIDRPRRERVNDLLRERRTNLAQECHPDLLARSGSKLLEMQSDVDAREEGLVEGFHAVRGHEEDPAVVLDMAEAMECSSETVGQVYAQGTCTHNTATMALRSMSWCERCSRNTSA